MAQITFSSTNYMNKLDSRHYFLLVKKQFEVDSYTSLVLYDWDRIYLQL